MLVLLLFVPFKVPAAEKIPVAILLSHDSPPYRQALEGFRARLADFSANIAYQVLTVEQEDGLAEARAELKNNPPRLILALGTLATRAAIAESPAVPVVATLILDAGELKGVANATGVTLDFPMHVQWSWFRRLLPRARTLGVLYDPAVGRGAYREMEKLAAADGVKLVPAEAPTPEALPEALRSLPSSIDALLALGESRILSPQTAREILLYSFRNRVPFIGLSSSWVKAGGLYALDRDYADMGRQCADMAGAILKGGVRASEIPPARPRKTLYAINLKTAEHMKLEFPDEVVRDAAEVFR